MNYPKLDLSAAQQVFESFSSARKAVPLPNEKMFSPYIPLRNDLLDFYLGHQTKDYSADLELALWFYDYTQTRMIGFNESVAANNNVWRYLCCYVGPDIIELRHGLVPEYYYSKPFRLYLQALWWYIHLSYQGSIEATREVLEGLSTDYIMQLVERSGRDGLFVEVTRSVMKQLHSVSAEERNKTVNGANLFRRVMIQNTAKMASYNLVLDGAADEYVASLFAACGVHTGF